jgi:hypothetical protein
MATPKSGYKCKTMDSRNPRFMRDCCSYSATWKSLDALFLLTVYFRCCLYLTVRSEFLAPCNRMVMNERWKEAVVAWSGDYSEVNEGTTENQSGFSMSRLRFETSTSGIKAEIFTATPSCSLKFFCHLRLDFVRYIVSLGPDLMGSERCGRPGPSAEQK